MSCRVDVAETSSLGLSVLLWPDTWKNTWFRKGLETTGHTSLVGVSTLSDERFSGAVALVGDLEGFLEELTEEPSL